MSTQLRSIRVLTREEKVRNEIEVFDTLIKLNAFFGGSGRGRCLQLGIFNGAKSYNATDGRSVHTHLTVDDAIELRKVLTQFIEREY